MSSNWRLPSAIGVYFSIFGWPIRKQFFYNRECLKEYLGVTNNQKSSVPGHGYFSKLEQFESLHCEKGELFMVLFISQKHIMLEIENSTKPVREVFCKQKIRLEQTKLQYTQIQWKLTDCSSLGFLWTTIIHCNKYLNMNATIFLPKARGRLPGCFR